MNQFKNLRNIYFALISATAIFAGSCSTESYADLSSTGIIPAPREIENTDESFTVNRAIRVSTSSGLEDVKGVGRLLSLQLENYCGITTELIKKSYPNRKRGIYLDIQPDSAAFYPEGYLLNIDRKGITISASTPEGLFRGAQTMLQIFILTSAAKDSVSGKWIIPAGMIKDFPEYEYRGTMLDVSRHFFGVEDVKRHIDLLSLYKINILHLHLSDDQGWRIEIKSWPDLTRIGGSTEVGGGEGGYFTQKEYMEIVAYATERYITIVPEIDMPGHTNAALASYPELNCDGKARDLYTGTHVGFSTLCTSSEITYKFIDDVIRELAEMTPGPYIHIGGDESHVTPMEDYIPFINRVQEIVNSYGKIMIGWDEISHADLDGSSVVQYWANQENAIRAIEKGSRVILSPGGRCYLDMKYDSTTVIGLQWAGYVSVKRAYDWNPITLSENISGKDILGIDCPLWTETVQTIDDIEYMVFPRIIGHSELGWSTAGRIGWEDYRHRLARHAYLLDALDVNYYRSPFIDWNSGKGK